MINKMYTFKHKPDYKYLFYVLLIPGDKKLGGDPNFCLAEYTHLKKQSIQS